MDGRNCALIKRYAFDRSEVMKSFTDISHIKFN